MQNSLLTLNFLNANEKGTTEAERHWIEEKTSELYQLVYSKVVFSSEWKPGDVLHWVRGFAFVFYKTGNTIDTIKINQDMV